MERDGQPDPIRLGSGAARELPIDEGMQNPTGIAVSKEEEQFLRSAFRRFALPYVLIVAAVAWIASTVLSKDAPGAPEDVSSLRDQVAALETSVAALDAKIAKVDRELDKAGTRVGALESRKPASVPAPSGDTAALEKALRDATRRVADLERKNSANASAAERIDALSARMQRIEGAVRAPAASAPAAPPPAAPAPAPGPAPAP
jgi:hypothetical protein